MKCNKCDIDMKLGTALWPYDRNNRYKWIASFIPLAKLIIPCQKCPNCGKSEELTKEEYMSLKETLK